MTLRTNQLTRQQIGQFIGSERGVRAFEDVQADLTDQFQQLSNATFLTLGQEPVLGSERVLAPAVGELVGDDGGANGLYRLGLADVVTPGTYGDDTTYPVITLDSKGRVKAVSTRNAASGGGTGTVTSVALTVPTGFTVTGSPVTTAGTLAITTTLSGYVKGNGTGFTAAATVPVADITGLAAIATSGSAADLAAGTVPAARMPAHTGDVTSTVGTVALTIANSAVTLAKMADVATGTVFYRKTALTGAPEVQTLATLKTDLGLTGTNSGDQTITLTGDVTGSGTGSFAATIGGAVVTNAKLANVATATIKGRATAGSGSPEDLTGTQATALLDTFTTALKGLAPASGGGTTNFLRADGTWAVPAGGGGSGLGGLATVTVPDNSYEWEELVTATGVTGTSRILLGLAPAADDDENDPAFLAISSMSAAPGTGQMTISMAFAEPTCGAIKLNWSAM